MSYQVLARKWRPQDFTALVGQAPIVTALRNALAEDRIAQAYIFSGIRGVGKTTTARVLAKALNCETRRAQQGTDPCNTCPSCEQITTGSDLDVIEVDAATYSKVEQVRELTESLRYAPAGNRYKVVVLDEVHRLSRQAFDALLKIVEEPPAHLVFIFATTELDAVPPTILSRCQQFQFRRVPARALSAYLRTLSERESITATDTTLRLIARAGEGSVRDAVALLDQLATFGAGTINDEDAARLVGGLDHSFLHRLLTAIIDGNPHDIREAVAEIDAVGIDPSGVYGHFVAYVRDALHLALGGDDESVDLVSDESAALRDLARTAGYENLLRLLNLLLGSEDTIRRSELGGLALEITFLRAAELPKLTAIESLLRGGSAASPAPASQPKSGAARPGASPPKGQGTAAPATGRSNEARTPSPPARRVSQPTTRPSPPPSEKSPESGAPRPVSPDAPPPRSSKPKPIAEPCVPPAEAPPASRPPGADPVADVLERVAARRPPLAGNLRHAQGLRVDSQGLVVLLAQGDAMLQRALARDANNKTLTEAVRDVLGPGAGWRIEQGAAAEKPTTAQAAGTTASPGNEKQPTVRAVLEIFNGSKVERREPAKRETTPESTPNKPTKGQPEPTSETS